MAHGIDVNEDCTNVAGCLVGEGFKFVCRYYKITIGSHPLTHAEALTLSHAGLFLVAVWENGNPTHASYFSHAKGVQDGTNAYQFAKNRIEQPPGTPIYFAVDYDATNHDLTGVLSDYFKGIHEAFNTVGNNNPVYKIGVYGSGCTCRFLLTHTNFVTFTWLAMSTGFCGFHEFDASGDWNIKQLRAKSVCGLGSDLDETQGNGGGFQIT